MSNQLLLDILENVQPAVLISTDKCQNEPHVFICCPAYRSYMCHGDLHDDYSHGLFLFVQEHELNTLQYKNANVAQSNGYCCAKVNSVDAAVEIYKRYVRGELFTLKPISTGNDENEQ